MVPAMEAMGIRMLLNECEVIARGDQRIYLAGIDDAHFYRVDNIEKAALPIPDGAFSILLSHTPEVYRQAAHANFDLMLSGHTHGGQICLPGSIPIKLEAVLPRRMGAPRGGVTPTNGGRSLEISHDGLYLGGCRIERPSGALKLSPRNRVALSSARAVSGLFRPVPNLAGLF